MTVTVTVVYDGPAYAGKTTSVRSLAEGFGRQAVSPQADEGRTQYYDWFEYTGGRFDGAPIRCQVVSVPGQQGLAHRRAFFIERADVVIFVADTTRPAWTHTMERLTRLRAELARSTSPVGLVFQANKRDAEDALPLAEIEAAIGDARTVIFESVASTGSGVREAFVFAIRLALDRVRAEGTSRRAGIGHDHGPELVALLDRLLPLAPAGATPLAIPPPPPIRDELADPGAAPPTRSAAPAIRVPWDDVLSGFVWPPVEGRILLHEAAPLSGSRVRVTSTNDYFIGLGSGWRVHASARATFTELEQARAALIAWARRHTGAAETLSRRRCLVVSEVTPGEWRLWQLVQHVPSLREQEPDDARTSQVLDLIAPACAALALPCSPETIGVDPVTSAPVFVGLVPPPDAGAAA